MRRIGNYQYADSNKTFVMREFGLQNKYCRAAFLALEKPENGLGKVPADWIDKGYVTEVVKK